MSKLLPYAGLISCLLALGCTPPPTSTLSVISPQPEITDPFLAVKPPLGDPTTVRQAPYGPQAINPIQLQRILSNGHLNTEYTYDAQHRLIEKVGYYDDGHIFQSIRLRYSLTGSIKVEYWLNKHAAFGSFGYGYPPNNDLFLNVSTTYNTTSSGAELIKVSQKEPANTNPDYPQDYRLSFNALGQLVWVEKPSSSPYGPSSEYTLYGRDQRGNMIQTTYVRRVELDQPSGSAYQYDEQKNPYHTTGDLTDDRATNSNNIVLEVQSGSQLKSYSYTYRPDGYPSQVSWSTGPQSRSIQEFIYSQ